jgi:aromatic-L-amino-acid decarboxylase
VTPEYLRTKHGDAGERASAIPTCFLLTHRGAGSVLDLRNMQISLGRRFRSLKVWYVQQARTPLRPG